MILRQVTNRCTLRSIDLKKHSRERTCVFLAAECQRSSNMAAHTSQNLQNEAALGYQSTGTFLTDAPVELTNSSFLNYVWPAASTPAAALFNLFIHLQLHLARCIPPSV